MAHEEPESSSRPRYDGPISSLVDAIMPFATNISWLQYGEVISNARLHLSVIKKHEKFLKSMRASCPSLTFKQKDLLLALTSVREVQQPKWKDTLLISEERGWDRSMAKRMLCMFRHVSIGIRQQRSWASDIFGHKPELDKAKNPKEAVEEDDDGAEGEEEETGDEDKTKDDNKKAKVSIGSKVARPLDEKWYHWDPESRLAWRTIGMSKVASSTIFIPEGARPIDCVVARFADGDEWKVPSMSVSLWKMTSKDPCDLKSDGKKATQAPLQPGCGRIASFGGKRKKGVAVFWESQTKDNKQLQIKPRADRHALVVLNEDKRMICGIRVDRIGSESDAANFLMKIGEKYAAGTVKRSNLYELRDEMGAMAAPATCPSTPLAQSSSSAGPPPPVPKSSATSSKTAATFPSSATPSPPVPKSSAMPSEKGTGSPKRKRLWGKVKTNEVKVVAQSKIDEEGDDDVDDTDDFWMRSRDIPEFDMDVF